VFGFVTSFVLLNGMASGIPLAVLWTCELIKSGNAFRNSGLDLNQNGTPTTTITTRTIGIVTVFGFVTSFVLLNGMASGIPLAVLWTCELDSSIQSLSAAEMVLFVAHLQVLAILVPSRVAIDRKTRISAAERLWAVFGFVTSFVLLNGMASGIPLAVLWTFPKLRLGSEPEWDPHYHYNNENNRDSDSILDTGIKLASPPDFIMDGVRHAPFWVRMTLIYLILTATFIAVPLAQRRVTHPVHDKVW
jgi:hypothetical protein